MEMDVVIDGKLIKNFYGSFSTRTTKFTDSVGRVSMLRGSRFWWDPQFHKDFGITTFHEFIDWFVLNRDKLTENRDFNWDYFLDFSGSYLSSSDWKARGEEYIKQVLPNYEVLRVQPTSRGAPAFKLLPNQQATHYLVSSFYEYGCIRVNPATTSTTSDPKWFERKNYSYKMDSSGFDWFRSLRKESNAWFGLELEVSTSLSTHEIQTIITEVEPTQEPFFIFKQDSSVNGRYDNMLEIVTVPCSPRYLRHHFKLFFQKLEKLVADKGETVDDYFDQSSTLNNGLHIHVDRDSFPDELAQRRFVTIWQSQAGSSLKLLDDVAKRPSKLKGSRYCKPAEQYRGRTLASKLNFRTKLPTARETTVNEHNSSTYEIRAYQGIFDIRHIIQCISFTEATMEFSSLCGYKDLGKGLVTQLGKLVTSQKKYDSLKEFFKCA